MQRIFSIAKLYFYKIIFYKNIIFKNILKIRLGDKFKIIIENKKSRIYLGDNISFRDNISLRLCGGKISIGNNVFFNNFVSLNCMQDISIGDDCLFGENVKIYDHDHIFNQKTLIRNQGFKTKKISIGRNVWIGSNSVILKGVQIGDNVVIGAGTIVREDIPSNTIVKTNLNVNNLKIKYRESLA